MTREALHGLVSMLEDVAVPIAYKAFTGLLSGAKVDDVLTDAERAVLAKGMRASFDEALKHGKRRP